MDRTTGPETTVISSVVPRQRYRPKIGQITVQSTGDANNQKDDVVKRPQKSAFVISSRIKRVDSADSLNSNEDINNNSNFSSSSPLKKMSGSEETITVISANEPGPEMEDSQDHGSSILFSPEIPRNSVAGPLLAYPYELGSSTHPATQVLHGQFVGSAAHQQMSVDCNRYAPVESNSLPNASAHHRFLGPFANQGTTSTVPCSPGLSAPPNLFNTLQPPTSPPAGTAMFSSVKPAFFFPHHPGVDSTSSSTLAQQHLHNGSPHTIVYQPVNFLGGHHQQGAIPILLPTTGGIYYAAAGGQNAHAQQAIFFNPSTNHIMPMQDHVTNLTNQLATPSDCALGNPPCPCSHHGLTPTLSSGGAPQQQGCISAPPGGGASSGGCAPLGSAAQTVLFSRRTAVPGNFQQIEQLQTAAQHRMEPYYSMDLAAPQMVFGDNNNVLFQLGHANGPMGRTPCQMDAHGYSHGSRMLGPAADPSGQVRPSSVPTTTIAPSPQAAGFSGLAGGGLQSTNSLDSKTDFLLKQNRKNRLPSTESSSDSNSSTTATTTTSNSSRHTTSELGTLPTTNVKSEIDSHSVNIGSKLDDAVVGSQRSHAEPERESEHDINFSGPNSDESRDEFRSQQQITTKAARVNQIAAKPENGGTGPTPLFGCQPSWWCDMDGETLPQLGQPVSGDSRPAALSRGDSGSDSENSARTAASEHRVRLRRQDRSRSFTRERGSSPPVPRAVRMEINLNDDETFVTTSAPGGAAISDSRPRLKPFSRTSESATAFTIEFNDAKGTSTPKTKPLWSPPVLRNVDRRKTDGPERLRKSLTGSSHPIKASAAAASSSSKNNSDSLSSSTTPGTEQQDSVTAAPSERKPETQSSPKNEKKKINNNNNNKLFPAPSWATKSNKTSSSTKEKSPSVQDNHEKSHLNSTLVSRGQDAKEYLLQKMLHIDAKCPDDGKPPELFPGNVSRNQETPLLQLPGRLIRRRESDSVSEAGTYVVHKDDIGSLDPEDPEGSMNPEDRAAKHFGRKTGHLISSFDDDDEDETADLTPTASPELPRSATAKNRGPRRAEGHGSKTEPVVDRGPRGGALPTVDGDDKDRWSQTFTRPKKSIKNRNHLPVVTSSDDSGYTPSEVSGLSSSSPQHSPQSDSTSGHAEEDRSGSACGSGTGSVSGDEELVISQPSVQQMLTFSKPKQRPEIANEAGKSTDQQNQQQHEAVADKSVYRIVMKPSSAATRPPPMEREPKPLEGKPIRVVHQPAAVENPVLAAPQKATAIAAKAPPQPRYTSVDSVASVKAHGKVTHHVAAGDATPSMERSVQIPETSSTYGLATSSTNVVSHAVSPTASGTRPSSAPKPIEAAAFNKPGARQAFARSDGGRFSMRVASAATSKVRDSPKTSAASAHQPQVKRPPVTAVAKDTPEHAAWLRRKQYNPMKAAQDALLKKHGSAAATCSNSKAAATAANGGPPPYLSSRSQSFHVGSSKEQPTSFIKAVATHRRELGSQKCIRDVCKSAAQFDAVAAFSRNIADEMGHLMLDDRDEEKMISEESCSLGAVTVSANVFRQMDEATRQLLQASRQMIQQVQENPLSDSLEDLIAECGQFSTNSVNVEPLQTASDFLEILERLEEAKQSCMVFNKVLEIIDRSCPSPLP